MSRSIVVTSAADLSSAVGEVRRARNMTQAELADVGGLKRRYLSQIEGGRTSSLFEHTFRLLRRMGATVTITFDEQSRPDA